MSRAAGIWSEVNLQRIAPERQLRAGTGTGAVEVQEGDRYRSSTGSKRTVSRWLISISTGTSLVAAAICSEVPVLRAQRGWAPPDTWTRKRWPGAKRWAVALIGTVISVQPSGSAGSVASSRSRPSQMFHDA